MSDPNERRPRPDNELPGTSRPDQGLPGGRPGQPDQGLPETPAPDQELPDGEVTPPAPTPETNPEMFYEDDPKGGAKV